MLLIISCSGKLNETAIATLHSDLTHGRVWKGVSEVKYPNPTCHLVPLSLSLSCLYNRQWKRQEQVVLHAGTNPPAPGRSVMDTVGYWRLPMEGMGLHGDAGVAIYDLSVRWHCATMRRIPSERRHSVREVTEHSTLEQYECLSGWEPVVNLQVISLVSTRT